jgi:DNA-binding XRE family transcriptional regulator
MLPAGLDSEGWIMNQTNFDLYLEEQLKNADFVVRFKAAGDAWDIALQIAALRRRAGLTQKELAKLLGTSQQQISRLESPGYEGHSLSMLRRVAEALHAQLKVVFEPLGSDNTCLTKDSLARYGGMGEMGG